MSSNTLFHFMREFGFLKMAIKEGLWPRYNIEANWGGKTFAIPMLSFCDIPLSLVKNHIDNMEAMESVLIKHLRETIR